MTNLVEKVRYSLNMSRSQFEHLKDLDINDFGIEERSVLMVVSFDQPISIGNLTISVNDVAQEGDGAYFQQLNDWCRELDEEWKELVIDDIDIDTEA